MLTLTQPVPLLDITTIHRNNETEQGNRLLEHTPCPTCNLTLSAVVLLPHVAVIKITLNAGLPIKL